MRLFWIKPLFWMASLFLAGCATSPVPQFSLTYVSQCAAPVGASVQYGSLTLALGERPHSGFSVELLSLEQHGDSLRLSYRERVGPVPSKKEKSTPCAQLRLPANWQRIEILNQDNGQKSELTRQALKGQE